jgi:hypothetical protein
LTDYQADDAVVTEAAPGTVWYTISQKAFLRRARANGLRPVIVSGEFTELSEPMRQVLRFHGGGWAVKDEEGNLRNGLTGRRLHRVAEAPDPTRPTGLDQMGLAHWRPARSDHAQLMVCATAVHPAASAPPPGETIELLMAALSAASGGGDLSPWAFGRNEPALLPWDAHDLARHCRRDQEAGISLSAFAVSGSSAVPAALTLVLQRQGQFVHEHVTGLVGLGRLGSAGLERKLAAADHVMETLSSAVGITFALIMAQAGNQALTRPPVLGSAPVPLSILLGDGLIRGLQIDAEQALARFQASPALGGHGLMVPLDAAASGRPHLAELFRSVDLDRASPRMGISPQQLQTLHYAARY